MGAEGRPDKAVPRFFLWNPTCAKCAAACSAATSLHACILMFITDQKQHGGGKKCSSIPGDREFDLRMHINQRLHYSYEENMREIRTLYYQPGAQWSQTTQSNGKMSVELIYLSQWVALLPMKSHFLFVPLQKSSFPWVKIALVHFCFFFFFLNAFYKTNPEIGHRTTEPCREF